MCNKMFVSGWGWFYFCRKGFSNFWEKIVQIFTLFLAFWVDAFISIIGSTYQYKIQTITKGVLSRERVQTLFSFFCSVMNVKSSLCTDFEKSLKCCWKWLIYCVRSHTSLFCTKYLSITNAVYFGSENIEHK